MSNFIKLFLIISCIVSFSCGIANPEDLVSATIETCRGCSLNRLPEVKQFVMEDAPQYDRVNVKFIPGKSPEVVFYDKDEEERTRIVLSHLTRQECNEVLSDNGFTKKTQKEEF